MAKIKKVFECNACGAKVSKWQGRCSQCDEWGTVVEIAPPAKPPPGRGGAAFGALDARGPRRLVEIVGADFSRKPSGFVELDRVLGGGVVPGSLVLVGGDPGIGKSTLMLQMADRVAGEGAKVLYVTGEESPRQTRMRFERVGATATNLWLVAETSLGRIENYVEKVKPQVLIIDSIQTLYSDDIPSAPGSVGQLRAVTARLLALAKGREIATFLVGHVTKEGTIAGPRVLEHMVDTVLYFEGLRGHAFRLLRAVKNRFGSTDEIGAFEMRAVGLVEVTNPSALFLAERAVGQSGSVVAASFEGTRPLLVEVQALVTTSNYGTPRRAAIGADSNRVALLLAVLEKKTELDIGGSDVFVNVAGGLKLDEPAADLPIIVALASSHMDRCVDPKIGIFGEVGLGGEVRAVVGADSRVAECRQLGFETVILPAGNVDQLTNTEGLRIIGARTVSEALEAVW